MHHASYAVLVTSCVLNAYITGQILVDGAAGTGAQSGGGSGGGVFIQANDLSGHGLLSSSGGAGTGNAGGGAGGRIRLELDAE